jgi:hypothetical protein
LEFFLNKNKIKIKQIFKIIIIYGSNCSVNSIFFSFIEFNSFLISVSRRLSTALGRDSVLSKKKEIDIFRNLKIYFLFLYQYLIVEPVMT